MWLKAPIEQPGRNGDQDMGVEHAWTIKNVSEAVRHVVFDGFCTSNWWKKKDRKNEGPAMNRSLAMDKPD